MASSTPLPDDGFTPKSPLFDETLSLLREMIANACVNDTTASSGQEVRNADTLERFFGEVSGHDGVHIARYESAPGRVSIVVTVDGHDPTAEPLTFLGHTDVVPVDPAKWTRSPFGGEIADGRLYGRGAMDMLFITASMAAVTRDIARHAAENKPQGTLHFVGVADEEARGGLGAKWLADTHPEAFSWRNTISETGGSHLPIADGSDALVVVVGEKGAAQRRLIVHGDAGHASNPWGRASAIGLLAEVARAIAAIEVPVSQDPLWQGFVRAFRFDPATEAALIDGTDDSAYRHFGELARYAHALSRLTIAPTILRAGDAINVLPSTASLDIDIRPLPGTTQDEVDALLIAALGDLAEHVEITRLISEPATVSPTQGPLYQAIVDTFGEFFPDVPVVPSIAAGGSDLRFARYQGGVGYGFALHHRERTLGEVFRLLHTHDEYVELADVDLTLQAYARLSERFLSLG